MPLSCVAKAEDVLQKTVHLSRGGLCAEFTAEDIQRITDADVLRYLSTHSNARTELDGGINTAPVEKSLAPVTGAADMEVHMEALQEAISTFITVVDNEGCRYEIRVGALGHVQVPIDDDSYADGASLHEDEGDIEVAPASDAVHVGMSGEKSAVTEEATSAAVSRPSSEVTPAASHQKGWPVRRPQPSKPVRPARAAAHLSARVRQQNRFSPSTSLARPSQASQLSTSRPTTLPVRPQASLTDNEAARVNHLLDPSAIAALMSSPYVLDAEKESRLRALEALTRRYAAVRGVVVAEDALQHIDNVTNDVFAAAAVPNVAGRATDLGNAYMHYAEEREKAAQQLRSVNDRLRALQRRAEAVALAPADDVPSSIAVLRPSWAQPTAPVMEEAEIQRLLVLAHEEEARAKETEMECALPPTPAEPLSGLRCLLVEASARAADLLAKYESAPPVLRSEAVAMTDDASHSGP
ncbi:conserved hypothetical protein [Leishmania braziliensis MHOM/BR/75/M2904]|uniref:Uncharacterized protein n=2 Tax=Leishmania braziliensis TaxID=5660 RepID=A4H7X7_LEIBR|nr:conserved hypothetical protein [Leishmania braziliensis MHOM/BR/75/M2904]CAJ2469213.1 unnamed protein product [Leishmania braziliensis]CAJ2469742.1 unnamed protein product [Leishmania braziliensis]CAM42024.1 conserved hypothetical protein [Leishmania braziliensis MHOM/BR/75/M2904]